MKEHSKLLSVLQYIYKIAKLAWQILITLKKIFDFFIVLAMGLKPSPSGETFRFYNFCPFEVWNTFWLWLSFLVLRVVMRCATDWNALDNPSLINCRGRYCVRSLVRIGLQSVAHETSPNLPASAGSGSVRRTC